IRVPPGSERITFTFAGVSLAAPQRVRFRYKLDGLDRSWSAPVNAREAMYSKLSPGDYRFRLMIANSEGAWTESATPVAVVVEPVLWQTRWLRMMSALTLAAIGFVAYWLRIRHVTRRLNMRFEAQMQERERIARELHDTLLQGFQGITLRVQGVAKHMPAQDPLRKMIDGVLDRADEVLREARQRVRNLRRRATDENELAE